MHHLTIGTNEKGVQRLIFSYSYWSWHWCRYRL